MHMRRRFIPMNNSIDDSGPVSLTIFFDIEIQAVIKIFIDFFLRMLGKPFWRNSEQTVQHDNTILSFLTSIQFYLSCNLFIPIVCFDNIIIFRSPFPIHIRPVKFTFAFHIPVVFQLDSIHPRTSPLLYPHYSVQFIHLLVSQWVRQFHCLTH